MRVLQGQHCEKLLEDSPVSDRANTSRLQDGPTVSRGWPLSNGDSSSVVKRRLPLLQVLALVLLMVLPAGVLGFQHCCALVLSHSSFLVGFTQALFD